MLALLPKNIGNVSLYRVAVYKSKKVHRIEMSMLSGYKLSNHTEVWQMFFLVPFFYNAIMKQESEKYSSSIPRRQTFEELEL